MHLPRLRSGRGPVDDCLTCPTAGCPSIGARWSNGWPIFAAAVGQTWYLGRSEVIRTRIIGCSLNSFRPSFATT